MASVKINPAHAELISLIYHNVKNALESCDALIDEPTFFANIKNEVFRPIRLKLNWIKTGMDIKIPREHSKLHENQLKYADTQRLNEINRIYTRLTPEAQEFLETVALGLHKGEIIKVETAAPEEEIF